MQRAAKRRWVIGLVVCAAVVLGACSRDGRVVSAPTTTVETRHTGGTLQYGLARLPFVLNPTADTFGAEERVVARTLYEPLAAFAANGEAVPYLAAAIEPNATADEWTVRLRPDVEFHDGTPLDAEAVVANVHAQLAVGLGAAVAPLLDPEQPVVLGGDPLVLTYRLQLPIATFPAFLTDQFGLVASPNELDAAVPAGTGPFRVERADEDGIRVDRFDGYWRDDRPYLDAVEFSATDDALDGLATEAYDAVFTTDANDVRVLSEAADMRFFRDRSGSEIYAIEQSPLFDDPALRTALALATDRGAYAEDVAGGSTNAAVGPIAPGTLFSDGAGVPAPDPTEAAQLLAAHCEEQPATCGADGRVQVRFAYRSTRQHEVDVLTRQWEPLFDVSPLPFDDVDTFTSLGGDFDLFLASGFDGFDPALDWRDLALGADSDDVGQGVLTGNAIVDRLLVQQWQTDDVTQRAQAWSSIVAELQQTGRALFLSHSASVLATQPWVRGVADATSADATPLQHLIGPEHWFADMWLAERT